MQRAQLLVFPTSLEWCPRSRPGQRSHRQGHKGHTAHITQSTKARTKSRHTLRCTKYIYHILVHRILKCKYFKDIGAILVTLEFWCCCDNCLKMGGHFTLCTVRMVYCQQSTCGVACRFKKKFFKLIRIIQKYYKQIKTFVHLFSSYNVPIPHMV